MKIDPNKHKNSIGCNSLNGPSFGLDIILEDNANLTMEGFSSLGDCYKHPQYAHGTDEAQSFLSGSCYFQLDEVYQKE